MFGRKDDGPVDVLAEFVASDEGQALVARQRERRLEEQRQIVAEISQARRQADIGGQIKS